MQRMRKRKQKDQIVNFRAARELCKMANRKRGSNLLVNLLERALVFLLVLHEVTHTNDLV